MSGRETSRDREPERAEGGSAPFIIGGGETGALIRSIDWAASALGPAAGWPQALRTSLSLCVSSRFPIAIYWGPRFVMLYNDDLRPMVGANKHPQAMGRPAFEVLPEIRELIEPLLLRVMATGEAIWSEDLMLPLLRHQVQEESYFTFTYSPIRDESGGVGGVFCAVIETTFFERLRALPTHAAVPVVVHSSSVEQAPKGVACILRKPIGLQRLLAVVNEYCVACAT
jgi:hypothetical protein